jgi:hypothetical protein
MPTAPATDLAEPAQTPPGGDGHFIKGHWALAPVRHIRRYGRLSATLR